MPGGEGQLTFWTIGGVWDICQPPGPAALLRSTGTPLLMTAELAAGPDIMPFTGMLPLWPIVMPMTCGGCPGWPFGIMVGPPGPGLAPGSSFGVPACWCGMPGCIPMPGC